MNKVGITLTAIALLSAIALVIQLLEPVSGAHNNNNNYYNRTTEQEQSTPFLYNVQHNSIQDPLPGQESHQVVIAAPLRDDEKIYSGKVSFTASQPIEATILHKYNLVSNSSEKQNH